MFHALEDVLNIFPNPLGVSFVMPKFKIVGHDPIEIGFNNTGELEFMGRQVFAGLTDDGQVALNLVDGKEHKLEQSSRAAEVSVNLDGQKVIGVKVDVDMPVNIKAGITLVSLAQVQCFLLEDGTYFILPFSGVKNLPDPVPGIVFVAWPSVSKQAQMQGRQDVVSPVLDLKTKSGSIRGQRGEIVLIRVLV